MSKTLRHLWIERKLYLIPRSSKDILSAIHQVFLGHEDTNGLITFDGKKYNLTGIDIFERFIINWLLAVSNGESDPILNDDSGIPVEFQISQDLKPQRILKSFNHEKPQS